MRTSDFPLRERHLDPVIFCQSKCLIVPSCLQDTVHGDLDECTLYSVTLECGRVNIVLGQEVQDQRKSGLKRQQLF